MFDLMPGLVFGFIDNGILIFGAATGIGIERYFRKGSDNAPHDPGNRSRLPDPVTVYSDGAKILQGLTPNFLRSLCPGWCETVRGFCF